MKTRHLILLFSLLVHWAYVFSQSGAGSKGAMSYLDSAIYYCNSSVTAKGVDTLVFQKSIPMILQMDINREAVTQIEQIAKEFSQQNRQFFADGIRNALMQRIAGSDSLDLAIAYCNNIVQEYDVSQNPADRIIALTALLQIRYPLRTRDIPETFDYYTSRLKVYIQRNDSAAISISYFCLGTTYRLTGILDMAIYNFKKSISYLNKDDLSSTEPLTGTYAWMNHTSVLGQLYLEIGDYRSAITYSLAARDVRINKLQDSKNVSFLNCNIALAKLMLNELDGVIPLLNDAIRMAADGQDYPSLVRCYEIKGRYFLAINQLDSAEESLLQCKEVMQKQGVKHFSPAGNHTPDYYLAQIRILQNRFPDARKLLEGEIIEISSMRKEVLKEQKLLIEVYHQLGDSKAADSTFKKYTALETVLYEEERENRSKSFEVEAKIEDAENTIQDLETQKKISDITRKYLVGIAALLLVVAIVIFNRFRLTKKQKIIIEKEKHRSDELLLNILPPEVAEELKTKGNADAKHFDEVTVMFTDFKGFTQISEQLTPQELVAEIHTCFKAFDAIITRYNIEKIKTIGDAYMCAGGLPVANKTNAVDVVNAALEIQQFMQKHLEQLKKDGKPLFEIRIGIHTGPVVAGIVGVKKFAYDIWGDTVNIASRMESSGEEGKINISGSTYELVKEMTAGKGGKFKCTYRGKIQAKNKGEIDMYFVEAVG